MCLLSTSVRPPMSASNFSRERRGIWRVRVLVLHLEILKPIHSTTYYLCECSVIRREDGVDLVLVVQEAVDAGGGAQGERQHGQGAVPGDGPGQAGRGHVVGGRGRRGWRWPNKVGIATTW